jgi:hypothetical protein
MTGRQTFVACFMVQSNNGHSGDLRELTYDENFLKISILLVFEKSDTVDCFHLKKHSKIIVYVFTTVL